MWVMAMNNKGQTLILFVLLLPVMVMVFALVVDTGLLMTRTYKVKASIKDALNYGLSSNDYEGMELMLSKNLDDKYSISTNGNIKISVDGSYHTMMGQIFKRQVYNYHFSYIGYNDDGNIHIEEE